jgi:SAM-dependent methyltransferase
MGEGVQTKYDDFYKDNDWKNISFITRKKTSVFLNISKVVTENKYKSVLDAGCGKGIYTFILNNSGYKAKGFDFSKTAIEQAKKKYPNIDYRKLDGFAIDYNEKFDLIFANGFSPFNTTDFEKSTELIEYWKNFLNDNGNILIVTRTNFTQESPSGWIFLNEQQLSEIYNKDNFNKEIVYLYSKFWMLISLFPKSKLIVNLVSAISKKVFAKTLKIPVSVLIILTKK